MFVVIMTAGALVCGGAGAFGGGARCGLPGRLSVQAWGKGMSDTLLGPRYVGTQQLLTTDTRTLLGGGGIGTAGRIRLAGAWSCSTRV